MRHFFWLFPLFKFAALHATFLKKRAVRIWIGRENSEKISEDLSKCIFFYFDMLLVHYNLHSNINAPGIAILDSVKCP